jgi:hypothetical protein
LIRTFTLAVISAIPLIIFLLSGTKSMAQDEDFSVMSRWMKWTDAPNMLYQHLSGQALRLLEDRASRIATLQSEGQWVRRQEEVRETLMRIVGPFPEKTPLNPKVVGVLEKDGYRVEKLIYESMPNFYVTACIFIPDNLEGKAPAILYLSGHTADGFRSPSYQETIINLVRKGFVVLAYDPIGQGERYQYFDPDLKRSTIGGSTKEHSYVGAQCFISGSSFARHRIWDGIRAIDYLMMRDEVDPKRIGVTGRSGGGTLTTYIGAFDERAYATAPECYVCGFKRLLESIGPQDAEQNFYHGIVSGIDHADLIEVRAPKPTLLITTTRDFFSIQGARETYKEVMEAYKALGKPENFGMVEDNAGHESTRKNREAMYAFFQKHLNLPGNSEDEKVNILMPEELKVTETGQVSTSLGGETSFSINQTESEAFLKEIEASRKDLSEHLSFVKYSARELSGYIPPDHAPEAVFTGRYFRNGYSIEKYMLQGEGKYVFPVLVMIPDDGEKHPAIIYLRPDGKAAGAAEGGEMEWFVKQGFAVIAPDLIGIGETGPGKFKGDAYIGDVSYNVWFESILIGRSIVGIRAADIVRIVMYLETREDVDCMDIRCVARGEMCPVLLHAAAFEDSISSVALIEPLVSYSSVVMNRFYDPNLIHSTVAGALAAYDLPDVAACLVPRKLLMANITDQNRDKVKPELVEKELAVVRAAYSAADAEDKFKARNWENERDIKVILLAWLSD